MASLLVGLVVIGGCGGKVVVDPTAGSGGSGASSGNATSNAAGTDCAALLSDYTTKLAAAQACSPNINIVQCKGTQTVPDTCGCPTIVNDTEPSAVAAAQAAYQSWTSAGCGPNECDTPCVGFISGFCQPTPDGSSGKCAPVIGE